ncbi:MAG: stage IV sporulation protein A, partial [Clostridia bacterium]
MEKKDIYSDIAKRTQGDIYVGIVGPVRTGKSTFISKFMEKLVLPLIDDDFKKERALDELPQSAVGKTIMTTEPKFVPNEAVEISASDNAKYRVRLIDCVGYIVPSSIGYIENEMPRMVKTPWYDEEIPFNMAAEIGTQKVINEHSTIGLVITTDGSIGEIPRNEYEEAEKRVIDELKAINKPFVVLLNSADEKSEYTINLANSMANTYGVKVIPINCLNLDKDTIGDIMESVLFEFPVKEISIDMPTWIEALESDHWLKSSILSSVINNAKSVNKISDIKKLVDNLKQNEYVLTSNMNSVDLGTGSAKIELKLDESLFYKIICETTGLEINDDGDLIAVLKNLSRSKIKYDKVAEALNDAETKGYGIVSPGIDDLTLEEPEIVKQNGKFGVKLKASAPSIHLIRADIETEVSPIVGSEKQSEELVKYLLTEFEENPKMIWDSNIFGKSLHELVNEGLQNK